MYLNVNDPFCLVAVGLQGSGKSHTLGCVLEACLLPCLPQDGVSTVQRPMAALALHFDSAASSVCEITGLISPSPLLQLATTATAAGASAGTRGLSLQRENMIVLVSPTCFLQRKAFYGDYCKVRPLLFSWATLTADHLKRFMQVDVHGTQLYMASMLNLLRGLQRQAKMPAFADFLRLVDTACDVKSQTALLRQRLNLLKSIVRESVENQPLAHLGLDLADISIAGKLVIVDLTDPLLSSLEANGIFQVLVEQFRCAAAARCWRWRWTRRTSSCVAMAMATGCRTPGGQHAESARTGARAARESVCARCIGSTRATGASTWRRSWWSLQCRCPP